MKAVRTYQLTPVVLKRLHVFAEKYVMGANCPKCFADLCDTCQLDTDMMAFLADAISMHDAGFEIVFTTALASEEQKSAAGGLVH